MAWVCLSWEEAPEEETARIEGSGRGDNKLIKGKGGGGGGGGTGAGGKTVYYIVLRLQGVY